MHSTKLECVKIKRMIRSSIIVFDVIGHVSSLWMSFNWAYRLVGIVGLDSRGLSEFQTTQSMFDVS